MADSAILIWKNTEKETCMDAQLLTDTMITLVNLALLLIGPAIFLILTYFIVKKAVKDAYREMNSNKTGGDKR